MRKGQVGPREIQKGYGDDGTASNTVTLLGVADAGRRDPLPVITPTWQETTPKKAEDDDEETNLLLLQAIDYRFVVKGAPQCLRESPFQNDDEWRR
jgi:hypothetical protein